MTVSQIYLTAFIHCHRVWWNYSTEMTLCYCCTLYLFCHWIEWIPSVVIIPICCDSAGMYVCEYSMQKNSRSSEWVCSRLVQRWKIQNSSEQRRERSNRDLIWSWNNQAEPEHAVIISSTSQTKGLLWYSRSLWDGFVCWNHTSLMRTGESVTGSILETHTPRQTC